MAKNILEIKNLTFSFHTYGGVVKSVRDVSFNVREGEILGIVGESGCGKSVTSQCILKLNPEPPGFFEGGSIKYKGEEIITKTDREMRKIRGVEIGFIFQDPMTSLNPTMTVGKQIEEVFVGRKGMTRAEVRERALEILRLVGINEPERRYKQYPHELSGGMKQRVMIAIALVGKPSIIIADEPTTSLDVTIEAQILDLLKELRDKMNTSIILITHDLGVIAKMCDRVLVMYGGKVAEKGTVDEIFYETAHPYTAGLIKSIATLDTSKNQKLVPIDGTPPDLFAPPKGCPFAARCEFAMKVCYEEQPEFHRLSDEHTCACWLQHEYAPKVDIMKGLTEAQKQEEEKNVAALPEEMGLTYLFIAHDLSVVKYISDRVIVMYLGTMVEFADSEELYAHPLHPYTQVLLSSIPVADPRLVREKKRIMVKGEIPSPINPKDCCRFAERCPYATEECRAKLPELREVTPGHFVACHMVK